MSEFHEVARLADIPDPGRQLLEVGDRIVVLIQQGGQLFCIDDVCTHDGGPLSDGKLVDHALSCPRHGAKFDIRTGKALTMPATEDTLAHEVKVENGLIYVRLNDGSAAPSGPVDAPQHVPTATEATRFGATPAATNSSSAAPGAFSEERVYEELRKVIDPELFVNIVDLGLIYNVDLLPAAEGKTDVKINMTMTSPMCPAGPQMIANSKQVLGQLEGMGAVEVKIVLDPPWSPDKMTDAARDQLGIF